MYDVKKQIMVLELSEIGLSLVLSSMTVKSNVSVSISENRYVLAPYIRKAIPVDTNTSTETLKAVNQCIDLLGIEHAGVTEDIFYDVTEKNITVKNVPGVKNDAVVKVLTGKRYNHYIDKDFTLIYMDTSSELDKVTQEHFCGEYGEVINIPYQHNKDIVIGDLIADICVYNN